MKEYKNKRDPHTYVSAYGLRVDDPCKGVDTHQPISLHRGYSSERDLKYHSVTDSEYWFAQCLG